ncbi:DNA repair protein [Pediococcus claussenii]|nr:DNA repair protein [Pediococcus claussenii]ANZ72352.1 DNA repair protein [Pediococcus claussenii]
MEQSLKKQIDIGSEGLSNEELLRIFVTAVTPDIAVAGTLKSFWKRVGDIGFYRLLNNTEQMKVFGEDLSLARALSCGIELGRRIQKSPITTIGTAFGSRHLAQQMINRFQKKNQEELYLLCLDTKNKIKWEKMIFKGGLNSASVHPREIMTEAFRVSANSIILVHNHPSGSEKPSGNDIEFTKRMKQVGKLMGIELLDHLIVGDTKYWSAAESKILG